MNNFAYILKEKYLSRTKCISMLIAGACVLLFAEAELRNINVLAGDLK